jgi:hypothetical protein
MFTGLQFSSLFLDVWLIFLNFYEQFSKQFISIAHYSLFRAKHNLVENGMMDLATTILGIGLLALPIILIGYVRSRVRHALKTAAGKVI